jgi:hypothetical protein
MPHLHKFVAYSILALAVAGLSGCARDVLPTECTDPDFDCYSRQMLAGIKVVRDSISYWSNLHLAVQIFIALSGIVATIMIALQGDDNRHWTRPIGLIATAMVTGLTSALVSFHVPDNIDKLIDVGERMTALANDFDYRAVKLKAGRSKQEIEEAFKRDPRFREAENDLTYKYTNEYNKIKSEMLRLGGSAARLTAPASPPPAPKEEQAKPK